MTNNKSSNRAEVTKLEAQISQWCGGYVGVGESLVRLQEIKGKDFAKYIPERFGITYHRAKQLQYSAEMAGKCKEAGLVIPHNEAGAYRLYRLTKSPGIGDEATLKLWAEVSAENRKPTVAEINKAISAKWPSDAADRPTVADSTASGWIGKAVTCLQEAANLLEASPTTVDLTGIDEILAKIRPLETPTESLEKAA